MDHVELLGGLIRVNIYLLILDILLIVHFGYSYYKYCYRKGYRIDYWHFVMVRGFVFPYLVIYPFAGSIFNIVSTGSDILKVQQFVDAAFAITLTGYLFSYAGFYYYNFTRRHSFMYALTNTINRKFVPHVYNTINNKISLFTCCLFVAVLSAAFLAVAVSRYGLVLDMRGRTLADPMMKTFFNLALASCIPVISVFLLIRYIQYREKIVIFVYLMFSAVAILGGSRGAILGPVLTPVVFYLMTRRDKVSVAKLLLFALIILSLVFYLGDLRSGHTSIQYSLSRFAHHVAYGNNFSDVRDFAWVLSYWDNDHLLGKTYVAALISFIPRSFSEIRTAYAIGVYTGTLVGFDPTEHHGLRAGKFGEPYLNFGMLGVMLLGFVGGYVLRYADAKTKEVVEGGKPDVIKMYASVFIYSLTSQFYITAGFWGFYVFIAILTLGYLSRQLLGPLATRQTSQPALPGEPLALDKNSS